MHLNFETSAVSGYNLHPGSTFQHALLSWLLFILGPRKNLRRYWRWRIGFDFPQVHLACCSHDTNSLFVREHKPDGIEDGPSVATPVAYSSGSGSGLLSWRALGLWCSFIWGPRKIIQCVEITIIGSRPCDQGGCRSPRSWKSICTSWGGSTHRCFAV